MEPRSKLHCIQQQQQKSLSKYGQLHSGARIGAHFDRIQLIPDHIKSNENGLWASTPEY